MSWKHRFLCDPGRNEATENASSKRKYSTADCNILRSLDRLSKKMHIVCINHYVSGYPLTKSLLIDVRGPVKKASE